MIVLITGASSGIGRYTAQKFYDKGHIVYGTSRNPEGGFFTGGDQNDSGDKTGSFKMIPLDICDAESCEKAVSYVIKKEGRIDVLVNNAGMGIAGPVELTSDEEAKAQFEANFFGALRMCKEVLPVMRSQGRGKIINITSAAASVPIPFQAMYSASKAALESLSQCVSMETKHYGISVSSIEFGDMKTGFTKSRKITQAAQNYDNVYKTVFEDSLKRMEQDEQNGPEPVKAAKMIYKTALKRRSRPVIVCGFKYKAIFMLRRFLPYRFSEYLIGTFYAKKEK